MTRKWCPSNQQRAYAAALIRHACDVGKRYPPKQELALEIGVSRQTISHWHRTPAFQVWLDARQDVFMRRVWTQLQVRMLMKAYSDASVPHAEFMARLLQPAAEAGAQGPSGPTIVFNIPRPPNVLAGQTHRVVVGMDVKGFLAGDDREDVTSKRKK
jgi:hypothetical protein